MKSPNSNDRLSRPETTGLRPTAAAAVLRIHGVGEHVVTEVIGESSRVVGASQLHQSDRDPTLFALSWSRLTRTGFVISSFLMLPFALLNAAGFMTLTTGGGGQTFTGAGLPKLANVTVSASWILWGILLFWDLPRLAQTSAAVYVCRGIGLALGAVIVWRVLIDLSRRYRQEHEHSPMAEAMRTSPRQWLWHYIWVGIWVWFALGMTRSGASGLYALLWAQILCIGFVAAYTRLNYASPLKAHGLLSTDAVLIACVLSHFWGYALVQACAMLFLGEWREVDFYLPAGLVAGVKDDRIDTMFLRCAVVAVASVLVGVTGGIARWLGTPLLLALIRRPPERGHARVSNTHANWRVRLWKRWAGRPPLRPRVSWLLVVLITAMTVGPTREYARDLSISGPPPWLWQLPWRQISVVAGVASGCVLAAVVLWRSLVATAFDVLGFLPRQFHPWSPSFYADAAIRDTHAAIRWLAETSDLVWIVGHSQGSVIAYAALVTLDDEVVAKCRLVTCGSPLMRLYGWFFPVWFTPARLAELSTRLSHDDDGISWWNFYRCTDPIAAPLQLPTPAARDVLLHEPNTSCEPGGRPLMHSQYWDDPVIAAVIANDATGLQPLAPCCCGEAQKLPDGFLPIAI